VVAINSLPGDTSIRRYCVNNMMIM
jgi:hypothetical protein